MHNNLQSVARADAQYTSLIKASVGLSCEIWQYMQKMLQNLLVMLSSWCAEQSAVRDQQKIHNTDEGDVVDFPVGLIRYLQQANSICCGGG